MSHPLSNQFVSPQTHSITGKSFFTVLTCTITKRSFTFIVTFRAERERRKRKQPTHTVGVADTCIHIYVYVYVNKKKKQTTEENANIYIYKSPSFIPSKVYVLWDRMKRHAIARKIRVGLRTLCESYATHDTSHDQREIQDSPYEKEENTTG